MIEAAKEEMLSGFGPSCADLPLAASLELVENSRLRFGSKKAALHLGQEVCNSTTALGIERGLLQNCIGSRIQTWNRYAYVLNNPLSYKDPTGLWCVWEDGTHDDDPSNGGASSGDCADQGGHWDQFDTITGIFQQNGNITQINTIYGNCTTSDCGAGTSLQGFDQTLQSYSVLPNNAASTQSSWLGNLLNTPWMVSWILPLWPLPPAAGVGPAGSIAWNPATKNLCGSLGAGASVGDNLAAGPVAGKTLNGQQASPSQVDQIFSGWSGSFGFNVPIGPVPAGPGVQVSGNGSGVVYGPTGGVAGASVSSTYAVCAHF